MLTKKEARVILIIFFVIVLVFGGLYFISSRRLFGPGWRRFLEEEEPPRYTPTGVRIPEEVFTYNGKVKEVGDGYILLAARASNNYLEEDAELRITINAETTFIRYTLPRGVSEEIQIITGSEEPITREDIAEGDTVEVTSRENTRGAHAVSAKQVKVVVL